MNSNQQDQSLMVTSKQQNKEIGFIVHQKSHLTFNYRNQHNKKMSQNKERPILDRDNQIRIEERKVYRASPFLVIAQNLLEVYQIDKAGKLKPLKIRFIITANYNQRQLNKKRSVYNIKRQQRGQITKMEEKTNYQINYRSYLFQIDLLSDNKINLSASNSLEGELYELFNHKLEKIQSKCLVPALEERQPQTLQAKLTYGQNRSLILEIIVKYDFIPEMRETIEILRKEVDNEEKMKLLLKQSEKNLYDLQEKLEEAKSSKTLVHQKEIQKFQKAGTLLKLDLTPGDYEVTFNYFVNPDSNFVDVQFYIDNHKTEAVPNDGFYINKAQGNKFYPYTLKTVVQLKKKSTVSVQTNCSNSKFEAKEMVLLAEKITQLSKQN